jgi:phosphoglycolate phosphatase-like HAD superfamily hydrolase
LRRESEFRKPRPGMLRYLMDALGFPKDETLFVGDSEDDQQAAEGAGVRFVSASEFFAAENRVLGLGGTPTFDG